MCSECQQDPGFGDQIAQIVESERGDWNEEETAMYMATAPLNVAADLIRDHLLNNPDPRYPKITDEHADKLVKAIAVLIKDVFGDGEYGDGDDEMNRFAADVLPELRDPSSGNMIERLREVLKTDYAKYGDALQGISTVVSEILSEVTHETTYRGENDELFMNPDDPDGKITDEEIFQDGTLSEKIKASARHMARQHYISKEIGDILFPDREEMAGFLSKWGMTYTRAAFSQMDISQAAIIVDERMFHAMVSAVSGTMALEAWMAGYYAGAQGKDCVLPTHDLDSVSRFEPYTDEQMKAMLDRVREHYS